VNSDAGTGKPLFFAGLFLICMCGLMLQIIETRILSVITWYHLAFLAISMAMFGMTAGSLYVYFRPSQFTSERLLENLTWTCSAFAVSAVLSILFQISTVVTLTTNLVMSALLWLKLILILVPPYVFAGMAVSLALTRSPWPVPLVYGVDLAGAATGCLGVLVLLNFLDAISAVIAVGAIGALAAACFASAHRTVLGAQSHSALMARHPILSRPAWLAAAFAAFALLNAAIQPNGLTVSIAKHKIENVVRANQGAQAVETRWNSFSRIRAGAVEVKSPDMWGPSYATPDVKIEQRLMNIDGSAGTAMYRFDGDVSKLDFLRYDVTNLAYSIRHAGRAVVIGVGGGRDLLSAYVFGFQDVTGVELNPIFVDFLRRDFHDFNRLADLRGMHLFVDEARSWFARSHDRFDLIQMSMIDTWAATGAGAFSLSENGLYTVEGWQTFLDHLNENGVMTVSRWYNAEHPDETGRLLSLAATALRRSGVENPAAHIFLAASPNLATLLLSRRPLSSDDVTTLSRTTAALGFSVLASPGAPAATSTLTEILAARGDDAFERLSSANHIDLSPATDARPFFFQQMRMTDPASWSRGLQLMGTGGVVTGNLTATLTLALIMALSCGLVLATAVVPAMASIRRAPAWLAWSGTLYFLLIGLGFMFVEIGLIQRISVYLGHPVYGLAIGLFGIIVSTGLGSLLSARLPLTTNARFALWAGALALYLLLLPAWFPALISSFASAALPMRTLVCLLAIVPSGMLMGFGFPAGMQLVNASDSRPTPWFWAVNGAAGVFGASLAVFTSIAFSINVTLWLGAACYLLLAPAARGLVHAAADALPSRRSGAEHAR
jgi:hypothetical protein